MSIFTKWMTLLFSLVVFTLAGCGSGDQPFYDSGTDPVAVDLDAGSYISLGLSIPGTAITVGTTTVTADATVKDDTGAGVAGIAVAFQIVGTGDFGGVKYLSATTNANGVASAHLAAPNLVGSATITAATAGKSASVGVTYIPDVPAYVTLSASPATVGAASASTLTAALYDQFGNVAPNEQVTFSITSNLSGAVLSNPTGTAQTDASGVATMTYTSGTTVGVSDTVRVVALNGSAPQATVSIAVSSAATSIASLDLALSSPTSSITVGTTSTVSTTVLDDDGSYVPNGTVVAFELAGTGTLTGGVKVLTATTTSGIASVTLTAPLLVDVATVKASIAGLTDSVDITYVPAAPAAAVITASPATVSALSDSTLTATVYDTYGNVVPNEPVRFSIETNNSLGAVLTPSTGNATTNDNGVATIIYTSGGTSDRTDTVAVTVARGSAGTVSTGIYVSASNAVIGSVTVTAGSASIVADGSSTTAIRARLVDAAGEPIVGQAITFTTTAGVFIDGTIPNTKTSAGMTDTNGYAILTLESSVDGATPTSTGTAAITATVSGFAASTSVNFVAGEVAQILMYASPTTVATGASFSFEAIVMDANDNRIFNEMVTFYLLKEGDYTGSPGVYDTVVNSFGGETDDTGRISSSFGIFDVYALDIGADTLQLKALTTNGTTTTQIITIDNTASAVDSLTMAAANSTITADGTSNTVIRATVLDTTGTAMQGVSVTFTTNVGSFDSAVPLLTTTAVTDGTGVAQVTLTSITQLAKAAITAATGGFNAAATVSFVAGIADAGNSSLTVSPSTLPADGVSTATVTVTLADANSLPVSDGTTVTLLGMTGDATITSDNPSTTAAGRATFTLVAASTSAVDSLYLAENSIITGNVTYGAIGTGEPASIQVESADSQISVSGVGQNENTSIAVSVVDEGGSLIANPTANNLRITLLTRPNGGEYISGESFDGTTDNSVGDNMIEIATSSGKAVFNLQSGTLPGIVEILVETIGYATNPSAIVPQIVIASGPAHSIAFGRPITNAIINLGAGNYQRIGSVTVTDRYGNSVADGSVVNLGIVDSIIADGRTLTVGATASGGASLGDVTTYLTDDTAVDFTTAAITRNDTTRFIQQNDRVLLLNAVAEDKSRHVATGWTANTLPVQTAFTATKADVRYVVGAAALGSAIFGVDPDSGELTTGYVTTVDGIGEIRINYPAKRETILVGCERSVADTRHAPDDSADTYVVATVSGTDATSVTDEYCFSAIAGYELTAMPAAISATANVVLELVDGGDTIPLPFVDVSSSVEITTNTGPMTVTVSSCDADGVTDVVGSCTATITIGGTPASGDAATVTFYAGDATVDVTIEIP